MYILRDAIPKDLTQKCHRRHNVRLSAPGGQNGAKISAEAGKCEASAGFGETLLDIAPPLDGKAHKGQAGRIGVLGGSVDYAGAPYYAGMAALRVGAELLYLLTAAEATVPIKSYSPELMVSAVYNTARIASASNETA